MSEQLRVDDLIVQNLQKAQSAVMEAMNLTEIEELAEWTHVLAAMRGLPEQTMVQLGVPLIEKCFEAFNADPKTKEGRAKMKPHQDIIALCLQDCLHLVMQNMNRQAQAAHALRSGQGSILRS